VAVGGPAPPAETLDVVAGVAGRLGRTVVRLPGDPRGGVVDRVLAPAVGEAAWLVTEGADPTAVDASARAVGLGVGPLALADRAGLDRHLAVLDHLAEDLGPAYDAPPALRDRVEDGRLGAKAGGGFHGEGRGDAAGADETTGLRLLAVLARETAALDAAGVADPETVDRAVCLATGLARGPARLADETGLDGLVAALDEARETTGEARYGRADALRARATAGRSLYPATTGPGDPAAGVRVDRPESGVARVVLDRPGRANALDLAAVRAVARAVEAFADDPETRAVVLAGAGEQFCVGVDIEAARLGTRGRASATRFAREGQRALGRVSSAAVPVVTAVDGACLGAGLTLAASADLRVASERATFGHPARSLGLAPAWGAGARLPPVLGESRATELLLTGDRYGAARLHDDGFLTDVCADAEACAERALALATDLAAASPAALSAIRASVRSERPTAALAAEAEAFGRLVVTDAARAALRSGTPGE
jgi:enoyl-CoA hydratase/3-hydroxyacyl-CoA dehydrogenase